MENTISPISPVITPSSQQKNAVLTPVLGLILLILLAGSIGYYLGTQQKQNSVMKTPISSASPIATTQGMYPSPVPDTKKVVDQPQPEVEGWKSFSNNSFSFEYPSFLPEPVTEGQDIRRKSTYLWKIEDEPTGDVRHEVHLIIEGPFPKTEQMTVTEWLESQNFQSQEGKETDYGGTNTVTYKVIQGKKVVIGRYLPNDSKYESSWNLYVSNPKEVYRIIFDVYGTDQEAMKYREVFDHMLSTFTFSK